MECIPPFVFVDMLRITLAKVIDLGPLVREICFQSRIQSVAEGDANTTHCTTPLVTNTINVCYFNTHPTLQYLSFVCS